MSIKKIGPEEKSTKPRSFLKKFQGAFSERPVEPIEVEPSILRRWTRRDLLLFGAGALATLAVGGSQLPRELLQKLGLAGGGTTGPENKWLLNQALRLDDEVGRKRKGRILTLDINNGASVRETMSKVKIRPLDFPLIFDKTWIDPKLLISLMSFSGR